MKMKFGFGFKNVQLDENDIKIHQSICVDKIVALR